MVAPYLVIVATLGGVAAHLLYFKQGEHHVHGHHYLAAVIASFLAVSLFSWLSAFTGTPEASWAYAIVLSIKVHGCFLFGLYSSLIVYRLLFHPLNKFPGPIHARISTFWLVYHFRGLDAWKRVAALHDNYGPYVRIGPSELSVRNPKAVMALHGPDSKCYKGPNYDLTMPMRSLHTFREKSLHSSRRRLWSQAFSDQALRGYEQRIQNHHDKLFDKIATFEGKPIDMAKLFSCYSFDVMGDLAFGKSFKMLETSQNHKVIDLLEAGFLPLALHLPVWFLRLGMCIPTLSKDWFDFVGFCRDRLQARMKYKPDADIMTTLLKPVKGRDPVDEEPDLLAGDTQLIITAGRWADTKRVDLMQDLN